MFVVHFFLNIKKILQKKIKGSNFFSYYIYRLYHRYYKASLNPGGLYIDYPELLKKQKRCNEP